MRTRTSSAERPGDLDELLLARRQRSRRGPCARSRAARRGRAGPRPRGHRPAVQHAEPPAGRDLAAEEQVVGDRQVLGEVQFLVDQADAGGDGVGRVRRSGPVGRRVAPRPRRAGRRRRRSSSAWTCRRRSRRRRRAPRPAASVSDTPSRARTPGELLADGGDFEAGGHEESQGKAHAISVRGASRLRSSYFFLTDSRSARNFASKSATFRFLTVSPCRPSRPARRPS